MTGWIVYDNSSLSWPLKLATGEQVLTHSEDADIDFNEAVRQELLKRKKLGLSASAWRDGKVVIIPPEEIPITEIEPEPIERIKQ